MFRNKLKEDSVTALKQGDSKRVAVLRYLISVIDKRALQLPPDSFNEAEELQVLKKELKNKEEARALFDQAGRNDLVDEQDYEIEVLKSYLPAEMAISEVEKIVDEVILEKGKIFGMVMGETMKRLAGKVNGDVVSKIVREKLA
jgi:uncharacterized protein YqeY